MSKTSAPHDQRLFEVIVMTKTYAPHEQRVIDERDALDGNLTRLRVFFLGPIFEGLAPIDQGLLQDQDEAMAKYMDVLSQRIARF